MTDLTPEHKLLCDVAAVRAHLNEYSNIEQRDLLGRVVEHLNAVVEAQRAPQALAATPAPYVDPALDKAGNRRYWEQRNAREAAVEINPFANEPPAAPAVGGEREALAAIVQRANESGTGEMALIDTIHAMHKLARDALAALPASPLRGREREALQRAYDFLQDKSFMPDSLTHECTKVLEQMEAALTSPPEQPDPERDSIFDMCVMIVEEECYLDDPNGPIFKTGLAIRDRIKCAQRNQDKET